MRPRIPAKCCLTFLWPATQNKARLWILKFPFVSFSTIRMKLYFFSRGSIVLEANFQIPYYFLYTNQWPRVFSYTIVDYGVYTSFGYHTYLHPISKKLSVYQRYHQTSPTSVPRRYVLVLAMTIDLQMKIYSVFLNFT